MSWVNFAGAGSGSEARHLLGIVIVGGLVFSQVLMLYLTPVFYTYMEDWRQRMQRDIAIQLIQELGLN